MFTMIQYLFSLSFLITLAQTCNPSQCILSLCCSSLDTCTQIPSDANGYETSNQIDCVNSVCEIEKCQFKCCIQGRCGAQRECEQLINSTSSIVFIGFIIIMGLLLLIIVCIISIIWKGIYKKIPFQKRLMSNGVLFDLRPRIISQQQVSENNLKVGNFPNVPITTIAVKKRKSGVKYQLALQSTSRQGTLAEVTEVEKANILPFHEINYCVGKIVNQNQIKQEKINSSYQYDVMKVISSVKQLLDNKNEILTTELITSFFTQNNKSMKKLSDVSDLDFSNFSENNSCKTKFEEYSPKNEITKNLNPYKTPKMKDSKFKLAAKFFQMQTETDCQPIGIQIN